ncbi:16S rRNA (uracil(1498)-N(3))-methyltransferase [Candidatus Gracilibacteria bacterium]|nr:16S rRNA (uracil(1498)-N(3))-methyltransferase [Candidatus Gracilibacteria bacterium]
MQRFFIERPLREIEIFEDEIFHQVTRVLRMQKGDQIIIFCGDGVEYLYELTNFSKKSVECVQQKKIEPMDRETHKNITLYQSLPNKMEKLEWIVQKNTELGVKKIIFFRSDRSQKLFLSDSKKERIKAISREALEQCGGLFPVEIIFSDENLESILKNKNPDEKRIFLHTEGQKTQLNELVNEEKFGIFIGPEGGWSGSEIQEMNENNLIIVHLGGRILRTETAGMCMVFGLNNL